MPDTITVHQLVLDLLQYIGITSFTAGANSNALNRPGYQSEDVNKALRAINAGLEQMTRFGSTGATVRARSAFLMHAPTAVIGNVTLDGTTFSFTQGQGAWMLGCSIQISGDAGLNEITAISGSTATLLRPYLGATASGVGATVYGDAAVLPTGTKNVVDPVIILPNRMLRGVPTRAEFDGYTYQDPARSYPYTTISKTVGWPSIYLVESLHSATLNHQQAFLRINPMPLADLTVSFTSTRKFERATIEDVALTGADPGTEFTGQAAEWAESLLIPFARKQFMTHPAFKNREAKAEINEQFANAMTLLTSGGTEVSTVPLRPKYI